MQPSYQYCVESCFQYLRVRLAEGDLFADTKTPPAQVLDGVKVVLSGTSPCVVVEIHCADVSAMLAREQLKIQFARICGPDIYKFLEANHFYFTYDNYVDVSLEEIKGWQIMWLSIQNDIFNQTGQSTLVLIEDGLGDIDTANTSLQHQTTSPESTGKVIPLFGKR